MSTGGGSLGRRTAGYGQRFSPPPQYDPYGPQLGYLSESIHRLLTERECGIFDRGLADYHRRRNVKAFVECLSLVLNTNLKRQLLIPVRDTYVKPSDIQRFNELVQLHGLATSLRRKKKQEEKAAKQQQQQQQQSGEQGIKKVDVKRDPGGGWGFNIRGGSEHGIGIFVSWVDPGSNAYKVGLQVGDQILKAGDTNFESISHYEAVQLMKGCKKLRLWILSHGRVPGSRMAHKVYRWVDPMGRATSPPPDPMEIMEQRAKGVLNEADERKVTLMVESGRELGISIRGGAEHGLGIYLSLVEEGSVAEAYGLKVGDQILEVNGINFMNIVHSDAANALRAQPCMVMKLKDIGKLPHSRITTYGHTQWYPSPPTTPNKYTSTPQESPAFARGAGTQVMFKKQDSAIKSRGIMNEVARSVLTSHELQTFNYYVGQYEHRGLPVDDLVTPLLELLNTAEKLQLISEVRGIIRPRDLNRFNEMCVHREIAAKKVATKTDGSSQESIDAMLPDHPDDGKAVLIGYTKQPQGSLQADAYSEDPDVIIPLSLPEDDGDSSPKFGERTLTPVYTREGDVSFESDEHDSIPQKLSPPRRKQTGPPMFHVPPPPTSAPSTSTPEAPHPSDPKAALTTTLLDRRERVRPGQQPSGREGEEPWSSQWTEDSLSSIQSPTVNAMKRAGVNIVDAPGVRLSVVERQVRSETAEQLRREYEAKERRIVEEQQRTLEREKEAKEQLLQRERQEMERRLREVEEKTRRELEGRIRREAEEEMRQQLEEREQQLAEEQARREDEQQRRSQKEREALQQHMRHLEEQTKQELEERIWKEAEEHIREEFESRMKKEREALSAKQHAVDAQTMREIEERIQRESEAKFRREYEQKVEKEKQKLKRAGEAERRRWEEAERKKREEEVTRLESEEQARIELEDRIRREAEAQARAEYEARLQQEAAARARLAQEVQAHKAAGQRRAEKQDLEEVEEQRRLDEQQRIREERERELQREEEERQRAENQEKQRRDTEKNRKRELERKREENIRRREEEKRRATEQRRGQGQGRRRQQQQQQQQEDEEDRQRQQEQQRREEEERQRRRQQEEEEEQRRQQQEREEEAARQKAAEEEAARQKAAKEEAAEQKRAEAEQRKQREGERKAAFNVQQVKVHFGEGEKEEPQVIRRPKTKRGMVEADRQKAEEKLRRRMERERARRAAAEAGQGGEEPSTRGAMEEDDIDFAAPPPVRPGGKSYGGYNNLHGDIVAITITKVVKKLGIAIDGGANTKQKAVIVREISPGGCAAQTGTGLRVGQQLLEVSGTTLHGLKHRDVVMVIKNSFEGPMNKTLKFVVLDPEE